MTTIDQRILIPSAPDVVWGLISDIQNNPNWQVNCQNIAFLTSKRSGPGMRWRCVVHRGFDYVVETSAWYDGLGYEYSIVDGGPYTSNRGRIRLQEIAEGTIVQWTFTYEIDGLLGGLRNALGIRRQIENEIIDSLRTLWRYVKDQSGSDEGIREAKSLMRDALDYEARSRYRPRHPSAARGENGEEERFRPPASASGPVIDEPPITDEDTRPNPAVIIRDEPEIPHIAPGDTPVDEPDFLLDAHFDAPVPPPFNPVSEPEPETSAADFEPVDAAPTWDPPAPTEAEALPVEPVDVPTRTDTAPPIVEVPEPEQHAESSAPPASEPLASAPPPVPDTSKLDTAQVSIWEVFGLPRPSETQEMRAVTDDMLADAPPAPQPQVVEPAPEPEAPTSQPEVIEPVPQPQIVEPAPQPEAPAPVSTFTAPTPRPALPLPSDAPGYTGLRIKTRRRLVHLRRRVGG